MALAQHPPAVVVDRNRLRRALGLTLLAVGLFQPIEVRLIPLFSLLQGVRLFDTPGEVILPEIGRILLLAVLLLWSALRALDTRRLVVVRSSAVGGAPRAVAVDDRPGRVFVAQSGAAGVAMLDSHTGALVWVVRVGAGPLALAADRRGASSWRAGASPWIRARGNGPRTRWAGLQPGA